MMTVSAVHGEFRLRPLLLLVAALMIFLLFAVPLRAVYASIAP